MKTKTGDFVLPGDALGVTEEYDPADWTFDDEGKIRSLVAGTVSLDNRNKRISIIPKTNYPSILKNGVVVFGQISEVRGQRALMKIEGVKDTKRSLVTNFSGGIHISQADKGYVAKLTDEFHIGDLVEAKVTKIIGLDNVDLTTAEKELGVIKAMCTNCRAYMKQMSKNEVLCPRCGRKERRKISSNYEG
ncbi:MAG: exosome complex RNA-binding protein Csl4 [Methanobacteriaceae archaeon]|jgi:exosome complex component CSL4|nr:exosome complex RNA-binding protein Csl4 [Methanobacteriaceae archaeon]OPY21049.1 MAG: Exosome complex component Csl4 [Methanobacterium sp. PtaU1.Bin097]